MSASGAVPFCIEVITLVPEIWPVILGRASGLVGRAFEEQEDTLRLLVHDLRDHGVGKHRQVDDTPYGGGPGMLLQIEPLHQAITLAKSRTPGPVIMLAPDGEPFTQAHAQELADGPGFTVLCGRYEGFDARVNHFVDRRYALGQAVLSAGDPAAWCMIDATVRLRPGILGNPASLQEESFGANLAGEYPQYSRPAVYKGYEVPEVLRSGDHGKIRAWRDAHSQKADHTQGEVTP